MGNQLSVIHQDFQAMGNQMGTMNQGMEDISNYHNTLHKQCETEFGKMNTTVEGLATDVSGTMEELNRKHSLLHHELDMKLAHQCQVIEDTDLKNSHKIYCLTSSINKVKDMQDMQNKKLKSCMLVSIMVLIMKKWSLMTALVTM